VAAVAYCSNSWLLKPNVQNTFIHSYFNDLFAMPFMLGYANLLIGLNRIPTYAINTLGRIAALTLFCSIVWEGMAPLILQRSCYDQLDLCAYATGSISYLFAMHACRTITKPRTLGQRSALTRTMKRVPCRCAARPNGTTDASRCSTRS
jgi:hypothetical protein